MADLRPALIYPLEARPTFRRHPTTYLLHVAKMPNGWMSGMKVVGLCLACGFTLQAAQLPRRESLILWMFEPTVTSSIGPTISRFEVSRRSAAIFRSMDRKAAPENLIKFALAQHWSDQPCHDLGLDIPDREYWPLAAPYVSFPAVLSSQRFLRFLAHPRSYREAVRAIENANSSLAADQKMTVLLYESQFIKSADETTYGRLLVLAPNQKMSDGNVLDQWIQFAIAEPGREGPQCIRSVSIVAVSRPVGAAGNASSVMVDFMRNPGPSGEIRIEPTMLLANSPSKNCYNCHKAPVVPVHPALQYEFDDAGALREKAHQDAALLATLNCRIASYGKVEMRPVDIQGYGPCIGPVDRVRSDAFIRSASGTNISDESIQRVRDAMNCAQCHDSFAPINYPQAIDIDGNRRAFRRGMGLTATFVEDGVMPPGNVLTPVERKALWRCLTKEYFDPQRREGLLIDWLKAGSR
jgi:hypothetical protein